MDRLGTRGLLFILGCCLGWQLCVFCGQIIILAACFSVFFLLFRHRPSYDDGKARQASARCSTDLPKPHLTAGASPQAICTPPSTRSFARTPKSAQLHYQGDDEADISKMTSTHRSDTFTFKAPLRHLSFGRSALVFPQVMRQAEREVILAWLRGVGKVDAGTPKTCPAAKAGPALPLTVKRLAEHLGSPQGGFRSSQFHIDASDCSTWSVPIAGSLSGAQRSSFIPIKMKRFASHDYDGEGAPSRKVKKNELGFKGVVPIAGVSAYSSRSSTPDGAGSSDDADLSSVSTIEPILGRDISPLTRLAMQKETFVKWFQTLEPHTSVHASPVDQRQKQAADSDTGDDARQAEQLLQCATGASKSRTLAANSIKNKADDPSSLAVRAMQRSLSASEQFLDSVFNKMVYEARAASTDRLLDLVAQLNE